MERTDAASPISKGRPKEPVQAPMPAHMAYPPGNCKDAIVQCSNARGRGQARMCIGPTAPHTLRHPRAEQAEGRREDPRIHSVSPPTGRSSGERVLDPMQQDVRARSVYRTNVTEWILGSAPRCARLRPRMTKAEWRRHKSCPAPAHVRRPLTPLTPPPSPPVPSASEPCSSCARCWRRRCPCRILRRASRCQSRAACGGRRRCR
jgi:hypothetical protein